MGLYDMVETYLQNESYHIARIRAKQKEFEFMTGIPTPDQKNLMTEKELEFILDNPEVIEQTADNILIKIFREKRTI